MIESEDLQDGSGKGPDDVEVNLQTQQLNMDKNVNKVVHPFR